MLVFTRVLMASVSLFGIAAIATAQQPAKPAPAAAKHEEKQETWSVVMVDHHLKAMTASAVETMKKEQHATHETAMAAFEKAKQAAEAAKQKFDRKAPVEQVLKIEKTGLATEADADKFIADQKAAELAKEKAKEKGGDKPKDASGKPEKPAGGHKK